MSFTIEYGNVVLAAIGRNGTMKQVGLQIYDNGTKLNLYPLNSRHVTGNCMLEFPADKLDELILALMTIKAQRS